MQVWIGFKQNEEYVHEWTGEVVSEAEGGRGHWQCDRGVSQQSGRSIWSTTIMADKARPL